VTDRVPDNLALLYEGFGKEPIDSLLPGESFVEDGVEFVCQYKPESTASRFFIVKSPELVAQYREICRTFSGGNIVELGIAEGGSTALLAILARPQKLIAVDLEPTALTSLAEFVAHRGLDQVVRPYYGVDQGDRERLGAIVDDELGDTPLDLVFDDASHLLEPTRTSFETLFPRLRPGGLYLVEDWQHDHTFMDGVAHAIRDPSSPHHEALQQAFRNSLVEQHDEPAPRPTPLSRLALELVLARARWNPGPPAIDEVTVNEYWLGIRRGPGPLDPATFRLADHYVDHFGLLPPVAP
jgi:predicted O-methyltransferase YrrM